jgi:hypothetical protein
MDDYHVWPPLSLIPASAPDWDALIMLLNLFFRVHDASVLAFGETLKNLMAEKKETVATRIRSAPGRNRPHVLILINLTKRALDIKEMDCRVEV